MAALYVLVALSPVQWVISTVGFETDPAALRIGLYLLSAIAALAVIYLHSEGGIEPLGFSPSLFIALGAAGTAAFATILPQLSLTFLLIGVYGFTALVPRWRPRWKKAAVVILLGALIVPFAISGQTGIGFTLRIVVTEAAAQILNFIGLSSLHAHDVLILENGLAQVDAPCSGLKSLFTGSAFFLAASLVMQKRLSLAWLGALASFLMIVLAGNVARIVILVILTEIYGAHGLAELFHIPLGLFFFALACGIGIVLLTLVADHAAAPAAGQAHPAKAAFGSFFTLPVICLVLIAAPSSTASLTADPHLTLPGNAVYHTIALTGPERKFYASHPRTAAAKWRFEKYDETGAKLTGSILVVRSSALTALHAPEVCFVANGYVINSMQTRADRSGNTTRWLSVGKDELPAVYWMQSSRSATDNFVARLTKFALHAENDWVLVSILFDDHHNFTRKMSQTFIKEWQHHVDGLVSDRG